MTFNKRLTPDQALQKIRHFCSYQERCHLEVKQKLYGYGLYKKDVEEVISNLIENNYLNEERFAVQFAGGKFRMKHWGRRKIQYELLQKGVSSYCIKFALKQISEEDYTQQLKKLAATKYELLRGEHYLARQAKTAAYLVQKGFEPNLVNAVINEIVQNNKSK
jgi:regulatory protein